MEGGLAEAGGRVYDGVRREGESVVVRSFSRNIRKNGPMAANVAAPFTRLPRSDMKSPPVYKVREPIPGTPYVVARFIGAGGMGSVYEVEDTSVGKRYVLKTLNGAFAKGREANGLEAMMRREARALAQVTHPHIVDVITAGKTSDRLGLPYIVMEKLDGVTVRTMLRSVSFPRQSVWQIANELLDALYHLHHPADARPPMLHRDIKPENIFLARKHDKKYITKLLDLGIAVILDGQAHGVHGTPAYMAPEQFRNEPLTEHTDLYQAACVVFEMLTGRHPFHGAKTASAWIEAHLWRDPPRASEFVDVPKRVDDVLFAALSKLPSGRPRDAHALMAGLHALRDANETTLPIAHNTTVEDLHTAIEKRGESGYVAYATGTDALDGNTLEDAHPSFAVRRTEVLPHAPRSKGQTVPMSPPSRVATPHDATQQGVDRSAPTRSVREFAVRRAPSHDTEPLRDSEVPAWPRRAAADDGPSQTPPEPPPETRTTPFASEAEIVPTSVPTSGRGRWAGAMAAMILIGGLSGASAFQLRGGDRHEDHASERGGAAAREIETSAPPTSAPIPTAMLVPTASQASTPTTNEAPTPAMKETSRFTPSVSSGAESPHLPPASATDMGTKARPNAAPAGSETSGPRAPKRWHVTVPASRAQAVDSGMAREL